MGTYTGYNSRKELVDEVTRTYENDQQREVAIKKFFSGNDLWVLFERTSKVAPTDVERFIVLFKITRWSLPGGEADWGYKPMDESMCPYTYTCPLSFLELAQHPYPNGYPEGYSDWRAAVRAYHARCNQKVVPDQVIKLTNNWEYKVYRVNRGSIHAIDVLTGEHVRVPRNMLTVQ